MDPIPCYPPTPAQEEKLDHLATARREAEAALNELEAAIVTGPNWYGRAADAATDNVSNLETKAWRANLRLDDIAGALNRHIDAENAAYHQFYVVGGGQ